MDASTGYVGICCVFLDVFDVLFKVIAPNFGGRSQGTRSGVVHGHPVPQLCLGLSDTPDRGFLVPGVVPSQVRYDWTRRFGTYITVSPSSPYLRRYENGSLGIHVACLRRCNDGPTRRTMGSDFGCRTGAGPGPHAVPAGPMGLETSRDLEDPRVFSCFFSQFLGPEWPYGSFS